ncbi:MAG: ABC transporter ATP-binding protein [Chloroflexota bacterium]|nr:ABC transporter ATP-binding protein [Chloroflexota bacterium]
MMLNVHNLVSGYTDIDILQGVSIHVDTAEIVSIIGPNGCGKSTLMKTIFGLLPPRKGKVIFQDRDIGGNKPHQIVQQGMCYVPQEKEVFLSLTVEENLEMGAFIREDNIAKSKENVYGIFPVLKKKKGDRVSTMSGGEKRMVGIGRALMLSPCLLLLDEPSAGLSPKLTNEVFDTIQEINRTGTSILIVEQNARKSLNISHRGYVLDMGKNRFEGEGQTLLEDQEVLKLYLGG